MKVLYDHQAFTYQKWGGVSKSFCELIKNRPMGLDYEISIVESENRHLLDSHLVDTVKTITRDFASFHKKHSLLGREKIYNFLGRHRILHTAEEINKKASIRRLKEGDFDIFHPTFFDNYFLKFLNGKPFVLTVHDLMPELFGWYKGDPQIVNKPELCEKAAAIIAVSENTKNDLCRLYNVPKEKVHVVYHGFPSVKIVQKNQRLIERPYFLYVGRRNGYKNWVQTVNDFTIFHKSHPEVKMVCTGSPFDEKEKLLLQELHVENLVINMFVTDEQLINLYQNAIAFIFPSLYEGFGMPILEAFACGCPVMLNNKSCFPEIGGDAAIFFDSQDGKSNLSEIMKTVFSMSEMERRHMIEKGYDRLCRFSWQNSSERLFNIYKNCIR